MNQKTARGSIIYEFLIVILTAVLIASIIYPKKLADKEKLNTQICRNRMSDILNAELQYQRFNNTYNDTLTKVIEFLKTSPEYAAYVDSVLGRGLDSVLTVLNNFKTIQSQILEDIPQATDTTMIDSLVNLQEKIRSHGRSLANFVEYLHDRMKNIPNTPIEDLRKVFRVVDSKQFVINMEIVKNLINNGDLQGATEACQELLDLYDSVIDQFQDVKIKLADFQSDKLDSLYHCPTFYEPYKLVYVDTSAIKYINIYCPIDSEDIEIIKSDFLRYRIGGLRIQNHGKIEGGKKSWEATTKAQ